MDKFPTEESRLGLTKKEKELYDTLKDAPDEIIAIVNDRGDGFGHSSVHEFELLFDKESNRYYPQKSNDTHKWLRSYIELYKETIKNTTAEPDVHKNVVPAVPAPKPEPKPEPKPAPEPQAADDEWTPEE